TPYELGELDAEITGAPMVPKSVLNDLRRRAVEELVALRASKDIHRIEGRDVLAELRSRAGACSPQPESPSLYAMVRTLDQLNAALQWDNEIRFSMIYCDFEDVRRYALAVEHARAARIPIALATLRIIKPG